MQKKNLFGILILIAYFASCNQIHKTHYENGWYHILSQQKDSIAKESIVTVKDFVSLRMDSDENGTCVIVGQISKHKLKKWAKETEKAIGKHIAFVLDDTVITNPKVNARIENGVFLISLPHFHFLLLLLQPSFPQVLHLLLILLPLLPPLFLVIIYYQIL